MLAGDEVVVSKADKQRHGLGRFYSSIAQRPVPGLSFFALSLVDVQQWRAYPLSVHQRFPSQYASGSSIWYWMAFSGIIQPLG